MCSKFSIHRKTRLRNVPMPQSGYIINEALLPEEKAKLLSINQIKIYLQIVGGFIWISGVRSDILFSVMYLTWFTKAPRIHHLEMCHYLLSYLYYSKDLPLVLGGSQEVEIHTYSDSSLGTAPKGRSISGQISKLSPEAGAILAKTNATKFVRLSSFESELEAATGAIKTISRLSTMLSELGFSNKLPTLYSDNQAMVNFVKGEGTAKGVRHMELRMWYTREKYQEGKFIFNFMSGKEIPADQLTKVGSKEEFLTFRDNILGLKLLRLKVENSID